MNDAKYQLISLPGFVIGQNVRWVYGNLWREDANNPYDIHESTKARASADAPGNDTVCWTVVR